MKMNDDKMSVGGIYKVEHVRDGEVIDSWFERNLVVTEGLNSLLDVNFHGSAQLATWYIGLFSGNYTPQATDTGATIAGNSTELTTQYDEALRQEFVEVAAAAGSITNSASVATFTINTTVTVYGAFLVSISAKGGTSGTLMSCTRFGAARDLISGDQLLVTYTFSAADSDAA